MSARGYDAARLAERQMLLHDVQSRGAFKSRGERPDLTYRFVTISRDVGAGGSDVAAELAHFLGWHVYDREIVDAIARDSHAREAMVEQLDEKGRNLVEEAIRRVLGIIEEEALGAQEYHAALVRTLVLLAARGGAVIVGRGGNFVLRGHPGLHVRLTASPEVREARLLRRWRVPAAETIRRMEAIDADRRSFIHSHFGRRIEDPCAYDLVINTDHVTADRSAAAILAALGSPFPSTRTDVAPDDSTEYLETRA
jgi:cytidylate kinase